MRITIPFLLAGLTAGIAQAASLPAEVVENLDQYRIVLYLNDTQIDSIPAWRPGEGGPPMSLEAAVDSTLEWVGANELYRDASIYELKYKPVHNYEALNRWYYLVELRMQDGRKRFLAVLPDGTVVPANEEPDR
jgi:hypothetical protein